ncbi:hypothetical protein ACFWNK_37070 [Streptomyces sp. NPDC058417]|uniref:hypothetical protein n=1 Tax=unclassified Streptomyces TaxID=2593676 RepID=UPI0036664890
MSLLLLIRSWRVRAALLFLDHNPILAVSPLAGVGLAAVTGWTVPGWLPTAVGWTTGLLIAATLAGMRLHAELDAPGVPCRWCDLVLEDELS